MHRFSWFWPALRMAGLFCVGLSSRGWALNWDATQATVRVPPSEGSVSAAFLFTNPGPRPVTIRAIEVGCDCTHAAADRSPVAAGASGVVTVQVDRRGRTDDFSSVVYVTTDESGVQPTVLTLAIRTLWRLRVSTSLLGWRTHGPLSSRTVVCTATGPAITELKVAGGAGAACTTTAVQPGHTYQVIVTPLPPVNHASGTLTLTAHFADGSTESAHVQLHVAP